MKLRLISLTLLSLLFSFVLNAQELQPCPLSIKSAESTEIGILVKDLNTGDAVIDINSHRTFIPASVTKLLTVASVLSQMPADLRFSTKCYLTGVLNEQTVNGDIVIECCGDPTIDSSHFKLTNGICDSIASALADMHVATISGRIIFDFPYPLEESVPKGWMNEDLVWPYGTAHHALNYKDNKMTLSLSSGTTSPRTQRLKLNRVAGNRVSKSRESNTINVGVNAKGALSVSMPDPFDAFECALIDALERKHINIELKDIEAADNRIFVYEHKSPTYYDIMKSLMFRSDNMMAEAMLRTLAPTRTRASATQREMSLWEARGLDTKNIYVEDGSGLSRKNRISPQFLSDVLQWMIGSPDARDFVTFFPKAGRDGTMRNVMKGTALDGIMATKTGSMRGVQCFAGYLLNQDEKPTHTVVVMVNGFKCDRTVLKDSIGKFLIDTLNLK